jgi:hypothetical protein
MSKLCLKCDFTSLWLCILSSLVALYCCGVGPWFFRALFRHSWSPVSTCLHLPCSASLPSGVCLVVGRGGAGVGSVGGALSELKLFVFLLEAKGQWI